MLFDVLLGSKEVLKKFYPKIIFEASDDELDNIEGLLNEYNYRIEQINKNNFLAQ